MVANNFIDDKNERRISYPEILTMLNTIESKMENSEKIHRLELEVNSVLLYIKNDQSRYDALFQDQRKLLEKIDTILFGRDGNSGIITDIYALKEYTVNSKKQRDDQIKWIWGVLATVLASVILLWLTKIVRP